MTMTMKSVYSIENNMNQKRFKGLVGLYWSNFHMSFKLHGYLHQDMMSMRRAHRKEQHFAK